MASASRNRDGRARILEAARKAFGDYGYNSTTTRAIAQRAEVSEAMIFRHFGTKADLFDAAVLSPFTEFLTRHMADWEEREPGSARALDEAERLFEHLLGLFLAQRTIVVTLLAAYHFDDTTAALHNRLETAMRDVVAMVEARTLREANARGNAGFDVSALARIMVGMCFSLATFPKLFAMDQLPRTRLVREMARTTMHGVEFRELPLTDERPTLQRYPAEPRHLHGGARAYRSRTRIDDDTWTLIAPILETPRGPGRRGRRPISDRAALEGIIDVLNSASAWGQLPATRYGVSGITCWRRLKTWQQQGIWPTIATTLRSAGLDISG